MADSASTETLDAEIDYRAIEILAILGFIVALASPLALLAPVLWLVPILGMLTNLLALARIRRDGSLGRTVALAGLALSTVFLTLPVARMLAADAILRQQARPVAEQFFTYLAEGSPEKAAMLVRVADQRRPLDEGLWLFYQADDDARGDLQELVNQPPIRMLLALGKRADVKFFRTANLGSSGDRAQVEYVYSVTFDDVDGKKKTYFVDLLMERKPTPSEDLNPWRVKNFAGNLDPRKAGWL